MIDVELLRSNWAVNIMSVENYYILVEIDFLIEFLHKSISDFDDDKSYPAYVVKMSKFFVGEVLIHENQ